MKDPNKIVESGKLPPWTFCFRQDTTFPGYYHWERVHMPRFMSHSPAWKRRKVLKGNWSKP